MRRVTSGRATGLGRVLVAALLALLAVGVVVDDGGPAAVAPRSFEARPGAAQ